MIIKQVIEFFQDKRDTPCDITKKIIESGFQQRETKDSYLYVAKVSGVTNPSQWWHLMSYCLKKYEQGKENDIFRYVPCGELIFWMAEVSEAVSKDELNKLSERIIDEKTSRQSGNEEIKSICWEKIIQKVAGN